MEDKTILSLIEAEREKMAKEMVYAKEYLRKVRSGLTPEQIGKLNGEIDTRHEALSSIDRILAAVRKVALTEDERGDIDDAYEVVGNELKIKSHQYTKTIKDKLKSLTIADQPRKGENV